MRKEMASNFKVTARLTEQEKEKLVAASKQLNLTMAEFIRTAIVEKMEKMESEEM